MREFEKMTTVEINENEKLLSVEEFEYMDIIESSSGIKSFFVHRRGDVVVLKKNWWYGADTYEMNVEKVRLFKRKIDIKENHFVADDIRYDIVKTASDSIYGHATIEGTVKITQLKRNAYGILSVSEIGSIDVRHYKVLFG